MHASIVDMQNRLSELGLDAFVVFTSDDHGSEYVVDHYKFRAYLSGFTGSAGTLVVTRKECLLWTDGRYFIQAARPEVAEPLCEAVKAIIEAKGIHVETGRFRTHMQVELVNDGPVTILLDSRKGF